jgi:uncharacterized protein (TIGR02271 family)
MTTRSESTSNNQDLADLTGRQVYDAEGNKIGTVSRIYQSNATGERAWVTVTTGLFGSKETFVPLNGAQADDKGLHLTVHKDSVKDAPRIDADGGQLSEAETAELYRHYGMTPTGIPLSSGKPGAAGGTLPPQRTEMGHEAGTGPAVGGKAAARADSGDVQRQWMLRSEERLRADIQTVETGRVRLHKHVVTTQETLTVPVRHEEVRVIREPVKPGEMGTDAAISDEEREVILHEDRAIAVKEIVPVERVSLDVEMIQENREISETVRHEEIDIDDNKGPRR